MGFDRFQRGVLFRILVLLSLSLGLAFVLAETSWFFTPLVIGILLILFLFSLQKRVEAVLD